MEPGWDDDGEFAPHRRRNPVLAVIAVVLVFGLVAGGVVIAFDRTADAPGGGAVAAKPTTPLPPPSPTELEAAVAELSDFVASVRELSFTEEVPVTLLPDEAFAARVREDAVDDLAELEQTERTLEAIGLLDGGVDLAEVLTSFLGDGVVGFYDPETGELLLRGAALTPYVRLTLVHELTHALDDQHFELDRPAFDDADDERGYAFSALVEGNALRVEDSYRETMDDAERDDADAEEARLGAAIDLAGVPRVIPELIGFPYVFGPALTDALLRVGGEDRVNEAFSTPPSTTEQVLDPGAWLAGRAEPVRVPAPDAGGDVFDEGVLGLWGIVLLLEDELGQTGAVEAAKGWGGDWYVAWDDGPSTCVRTTFVMDTDADLDELADALDDWAAGSADAEVERTDTDVSFTACT